VNPFLTSSIVFFIGYHCFNWCSRWAHQNPKSSHFCSSTQCNAGRS